MKSVIECEGVRYVVTGVLSGIKVLTPAELHELVEAGEMVQEVPDDLG
jgi:hypothetical protein